MSKWSFKEQRRLMEIAASSKTFEEIVKRSGRSAEGIRTMAIQLGIRLPGPKVVRARRVRSAPRLKAKK